MSFKEFALYESNAPLAEALLRAFDEKATLDATLISAHFVRTNGRGPSDLEGLDIALEICDTNPDRPYILYGFDSRSRMMQDPRFVAFIGKKNTEYFQAPFLLYDVKVAVDRLHSAGKIEDKLAQELLALAKMDKSVPRLKHDLHHAKSDPDRMPQWLADARSAGFQGSDEDIINAVELWKRDKVRLFEGKFFEGVFVDVQGTLLDSHDHLKVEVKSLAEKLSGGRQITVWTGGDLEKLSAKLRDLGIIWKIISKYDLAGAEVEIVIDDQSQEEFESTYQIKARTFHQI